VNYLKNGGHDPEGKNGHAVLLPKGKRGEPISVRDEGGEGKKKK